MPRNRPARRNDEPPADSGDSLLTFRDDEALGYCLRRAQVSVFQEFLSTFEDVSLRPVEYSILTLVHDNPGRKQIEISDVLGFAQPSAFSRAFNRTNGVSPRRYRQAQRRASGD